MSFYCLATCQRSENIKKKSENNINHFIAISENYCTRDQAGTKIMSAGFLCYLNPGRFALGCFALVFGVGRFALIRWVVSPVSRFARESFRPGSFRPNIL